MRVVEQSKRTETALRGSHELRRHSYLAFTRKALTIGRHRVPLTRWTLDCEVIEAWDHTWGDLASLADPKGRQP